MDRWWTCARRLLAGWHALPWWSQRLLLLVALGASLVLSLVGSLSGVAAAGAGLSLPWVGVAWQPTPTPVPATPTPPAASPVPSGPYSSWTPPPGYHSFAVSDFPGDPWHDSFGQCTWWAAHQRPDENFLYWGDAWNWANAARARGYPVTATPAPNATVVFAPGVQGASNLGHVSHVEQVLTGGWVLVSEMNFFWNGGGFARVDYRYVHAGTGVWFIH
jgi:surface antigen